MTRISRLLTSIFAVLLAAAATARAEVFNPEVFTLPNGLQVVVLEDDRVPVVTHMVWYRVGSADEPLGKSGIAHFLEHLMFKGTEEVPAGEFSRIIARNGGRDNAFTSYDYTSYFQNVAKDKLELVMKLEADRMVNLRLDEDSVKTEREVVLEERRSRTDNRPAGRLGEAANAAQYLHHPYRRPVIGWQHEIEALTRQDALDFYKAHYAPNNAVLIVAGDVPAEEVRRLAETYYGGIPRREMAPRERVQEPPQIAARRVRYEDETVSQPSVSRTYLAPSRTAGETRHAIPLSLLSDVLGGGTTSRLYQKLVVEQGVAASAGSWYDGISLDLTTFHLYASPVPGGDLAKVEEAMDAVIAELLAQGITEEELDRAKNRRLADVVYARDDLASGPRIFGSALTTGMTVEQVEEWPDLVRAVTVEDVNEAARAVLDLRRSVTAILAPKPAS